MEQRQYSDAPEIKLEVGAILGLDDGTVFVKLRDHRNIDE
jgi:hypothetical protein